MSNAVQGWGGEADYVLGTAEGWDAFTVVRWHGVEAISAPYEYEITLQRSSTTGPADLDKLIDAGASFAIGQGGTPRIVHGILAEAEEIDRTTSFTLYRVLLEVTGSRTTIITGGDVVTAKGDIESDSKSSHMFTSKGARFDLSENFHVKVHGCELMMSPGHIILRNGSGAAIGLHGGTIQIICPSGLRVTSGDVKVNAGTGEVEILGSTINLG